MWCYNVYSSHSGSLSLSHTHTPLQKETGSGTCTKVKVLPRIERSPPPPSSLSLQSLGSSLELTEKKLNRRQSEKQLLDSITLKVSNLLSMKASG